MGAAGPAEQARAARRRLGKDTEVHLIVTVRALHRQLPASWQEQVKGGMSLPFRLFLNRVRDREGRGEWFWDVQDAIDILDRWGPRARPSQVHIVTVPIGSSDPDLLWARFSSVLSLRDFQKEMHAITFDQPSFTALAPHVIALAEAEGGQQT